MEGLDRGFLDGEFPVPGALEQVFGWVAGFHLQHEVWGVCGLAVSKASQPRQGQWFNTVDAGLRGGDPVVGMVAVSHLSVGAAWCRFSMGN